MKQKIYITCLHMKHGGVEKLIASLANKFAENGFLVEILCTYYFGKPVYELNEAVQIRYLTNRLPNREEFLAAKKSGNLLRTIVEGIRASVTLHVKKHTMIDAIRNIHDGVIISTRHEHSVLLSKYADPSVLKIAQLHNDHRFDATLISDFQEKYENIDYFVLLTEQTCEEVKGFLKGHNNHTKCLTIPNFIEIPLVDTSIQKKKQVIAAGRLHEDKDFSALLRIWAVAKQNLDEEWKLLIAGEGLLESALKAEASTLGIADSVCFVGALDHDDLLGEMAASYAYLMTSKEESFGLVLAEAMACATPAISFDVRVGPKVIIEDGVTGFLVENRDEKVFAQKLTELLQQLEKALEMGKIAKQKIVRFYPENVMPLWAELIDENHDNGKETV